MNHRSFPVNRSDLSRFPAMMGIVNVTPDSFSDGGLYSDFASALRHGRELAADGAAIIDVGGESTRPGFRPVSAAEERRRVIPVAEALSEDGLFVSIDTTRAETARAALEAGARMINDISGGLFDPEMVSLAADRRCWVCLGHIFPENATPEGLHNPYTAESDVVEKVLTDLRERRDCFLAAGVPRGRIVLDLGIGFGKTAEQNLAILDRIDSFHRLDCRLAVGVSRKRFLGGDTLQEKDRRTALWTSYLVKHRIDIIRVHQINPSSQTQ